MMDILVGYGDQLSLILGWPAWALWIITTMSVLVGITSVFEMVMVGQPVKDSSLKGEGEKRVTMEFRWFQLQYLGVYLIIMLADWLQGTNMYTLYSVSFTCPVFLCYFDCKYFFIITCFIVLWCQR